MNLLCETHIRYKSGLTLFEHASNSFSDVYGTFLDDVSIGKNIKFFSYRYASKPIITRKWNDCELVASYITPSNYLLKYCNTVEGF